MQENEKNRKLVHVASLSQRKNHFPLALHRILRTTYRNQVLLLPQVSVQVLGCHLLHLKRISGLLLPLTQKVTLHSHSYLGEIIILDEKQIQEIVTPNKCLFATVQDSKRITSLNDPAIDLDESF